MNKLQDYPIHPLAQKVPQTGAMDYQLVKASITREGQEFPIIRDKGLIIDGRTRLRICCELGIEPRFEEYSGTLPVEQYILVTNLRRNLTKLEREQMLADFASVILPQIDEEMKRREQEGLAKGHKLPGRVGGGKQVEARKDSIAPRVAKTSFEETHPGTMALCKAMGATIDQARNLKTIYKDAPELLSEVAQHGGLTKTAEEVRKRKAGSKQRTARKTNGKDPAQEAVEWRNKVNANRWYGKRGEDIFLSREQIDPDFQGTDMEFAAKYGHCSVTTAEQRRINEEHMRFGKWLNIVRDKTLEGLLRNLTECESFPVSYLIDFVSRGKIAERRMADILNRLNLIIEAAKSIEPMLASIKLSDSATMMIK